MFSLDEAMGLVRYDPDTGDFIWLVSRNRYGGATQPGDVAGCLNDQGYVLVGILGEQYRAHRLAWLFQTGEWPPNGHEIDHANGDRADNRWSNLRLVRRTQNNMNARPRSDNKSGHRGVSWRKDTGKWHARIMVSGRVILLGNYDDLDEAVAARQAAERQHFGAHSFLRRGA